MAEVPCGARLGVLLGVLVGDGVFVGRGVTVGRIVLVAVDVLVGVGVFVTVGVNVGVDEGRWVGASPVIVNLPDIFHNIPLNI